MVWEILPFSGSLVYEGEILSRLAGSKARTAQGEKTMVLASTASNIDGYRIVAYKGLVHGQTWDELLRHAEAMGANATLNTCFDNAIDVDTLFHGAGVVIEPLTLQSGTTISTTEPEIQFASEPPTNP
jgi:uncharacterized protein YbjQ (UPF0145 family)